MQNSTDDNNVNNFLKSRQAETRQNAIMNWQKKTWQKIDTLPQFLPLGQLILKGNAQIFGPNQVLILLSSP